MTLFIISLLAYIYNANINMRIFNDLFILDYIDFASISFYGALDLTLTPSIPPCIYMPLAKTTLSS